MAPPLLWRACGVFDPRPTLTPKPVSLPAQASLCDERPVNMIVTGSDDATVRVWNSDGTPRGNALEGHKKAVTCLALLPDHR